MKIYIIYQIQPCQFLILVLYCSVCAGSVRCKTVTSMLAFAGSDTLTRDKMEKGTRDLIAKQMDVFMPKFPNASLQQIRDFLFSGQSGDEDLNTVGKNTLFRFIQRMTAWCAVLVLGDLQLLLVTRSWPTKFPESSSTKKLPASGLWQRCSTFPGRL